MVEELPGRLEKGLKELLRADETVHIKLRGAFKEGLVCTNTRVIILKGGFMTGQVFGTNTFQLPYSNIAGVEVKFHLITGYFEVSAGGMQNRPKSYWSTDASVDPAKAPNCVSLNSRNQARTFREACSFILARITDVKRENSPPREASADIPSARHASQAEVLALIERLGELRSKGIISEDEFQSKKADLLSRL